MADLRLKDIILIAAITVPLWAVLMLVGLSLAASIFTAGILSSLGVAAYYIKRDYVDTKHDQKRTAPTKLRFVEHPYVAGACAGGSLLVCSLIGFVVGNVSQGAVVGALAWPLAFQLWLRRRPGASGDRGRINVPYDQSAEGKIRRNKGRRRNHK